MWGFGGAARCRHDRMEDLNVEIREEAIVNIGAGQDEHRKGGATGAIDS
jgi:hypothetical protein